MPLRRADTLEHQYPYRAPYPASHEPPPLQPASLEMTRHQERDEPEISCARVLFDIVLFILIGVLFLIVFLVVHPFKRGFYCDDESIRYPFKANTVPIAPLGIAGCIASLIVIFATEFHRERMIRRCTEYTHFRFLGARVPAYVVRLYTFVGYFAAGLLLNQFANQIAKVTVGRPRPHFMDVCRPDKGQMCPIGDQLTFIQDFTCTNPNAHETKDSMLSFYSGHTAFSFYVSTFVMLYLRLRIRGNETSRLLVPVVSFIFYLCAFAVGMSRISDFHHHWSDVLVGGIVGTVIAALLMKHVATELTLDARKRVDQRVRDLEMGR